MFDFDMFGITLRALAGISNEMMDGYAAKVNCDNRKFSHFLFVTVVFRRKKKKKKKVVEGRENLLFLLCVCVCALLLYNTNMASARDKSSGSSGFLSGGRRS